MSKYQEYWLTNACDDHNGIFTVDPDPKNEWCSEKIHVIDKKAYDFAIRALIRIANAELSTGDVMSEAISALNHLMN